MNFFEKNVLTGIGILLVWLSILVVPVVAWFTHIFHCIENEQWGFLIAGAIAFPIAVVHGIGLWFGVF